MSVIPSSAFKRAAKPLLKKFHSLAGELEEMNESLLENPFLGTALGKNCYKIRLAIASKGKGKSGGGRVITLVQIENDNIFLLTIYDKSERENINEDELDGLIKLAQPPSP